MTLIAVQGNYCVSAAISLTCLSLMDQIGDEVAHEYWGYGFSKDAKRSYTRSALPDPLLKAAYRVGVGDSKLYEALSYRLLRKLRAGDILWLWPVCNAEFTKRARARDAVVVSERVNTSMPMYRRKVSEAYAQQGWSLPYQWSDTDEGMRLECEITRSSDFIFSPNDYVRTSLLEIGYPDERILSTSYGWSPERMRDTGHRLLGPRSRPRFLFVGSGSVRKGLPVLLKAWRDAAIDGELVICGNVDQEVERECGALLALPSVIKTGYVQNIADVYRSCDVFVFPTYEEGGPQVTFEAAGCGLALLVSPMGTAGAFRCDLDCAVADPASREQWVEGIRQFALDDQYRSRMSSAASKQAEKYTWSEVMKSRLELLRKQGLLA